MKQHQKTREWYVSFLGSQGTRYLRLLLDQRIRKGEELHDDLYIVSLKGRKLKGNSLGTAINRAIVRRIGKHPTNEPFRVFRPYGFRKFFRRAVSQLGQSYAEYLMGHTSGLRSLSATYNGLRDMDPTAIAALKREYVKVLSELETEVSDISLKAQLEKQQKEKEALADQIRVIQEGQAELRAFLDELAKRKD